MVLGFLPRIVRPGGNQAGADPDEGAPSRRNKGSEERPWWRRLLPRMTTGIGLVLLIALIAVRLQPAGSPAGEAVELLRDNIFDQYQRTWPRPAPPPEQLPVRVVDIDETSMDAIGQWPWPRTIVAELIDRIGESGAAVIGLDILFAEQDRMSPQQLAQYFRERSPEAAQVLSQLPDSDAILAESLRRWPTVVARASSIDVGQENNPLAQTPTVASVNVDPTRWIPQLRNSVVMGQIPALEQAADGHGLINFTPASDGVVRKVPTFRMSPEGRPMPALSLEMLRVALGGRIYTIRGEQAMGQTAGIEAATIEGVQIGNVRRISVPTDQQGNIYVHYTKPDVGRMIPAIDVLEGRAGAAEMQGRFVLIGTSAEGLRDLRNTPVQANLPGVKVHANVLESMWANIIGQVQNEPVNVLSRPAWIDTAELALILVLGLVLVVLVPRTSWLITLVLVVATVSVAIGVSIWAYLEPRVLFDAGYPTIALVGLYLYLVFANYARESAERRQVRTAFAQYLSPTLVDQLAAHPERLKLGGETRNMTLLFCDVRGFTAISEQYKADPVGLTGLINRLLTPLSQAILERGGTIDKYMGDCIMAFWNAPVDDPDHASHAASAALGMIAALETLNAARRAEAEAAGQKFLPLNVGIGINTGDVVVGNMGSEQRFDYSVLGDAVNLASRVEGQSRTYGVNIIVAEDTERRLRGGFATLELDRIAVKGRTAPVTIFAVVGDRDMAEGPDFQALAETQDSFLTAYRGQQWQRARDLLGEVKRQGDAVVREGALDGFCALFHGRIDEFEAAPPGPDWDGVYIATTK